MSDKIEIKVTINGKTAKLSDISDETLANMKKSEVKQIEHGDYGYHVSHKGYRLFVQIDGKIKAYDKEGYKQIYDANVPKNREFYTILGNIFKDMGKNG